MIRTSIILSLLSLAIISPIHSLNAQGLDPDFGNGGKVLEVFPLPYLASANSVAIQPNDQKIVVIGGVETVVHNFGATRLLPDGTFDQTFGTQGRVGFPICSIEIAMRMQLLQQFNLMEKSSRLVQAL